MRIARQWLALTAVAVVGCRGDAVTRAPVPARLAFVRQPVSRMAGALADTVEVSLLDSLGAPVVAIPDSIIVTIAIATNPVGGSLSGALSAPAVHGVAIFPDLRIDLPGRGYTLSVTAEHVAQATSEPFDVTLFSSVVAGQSQTCGIAAGGRPYCWGFDYDSTPVPLTSGLTLTAMSGHAGFCGLTPDGAAWCWGYLSPADPSGDPGAPPAAVAGGLAFTAISAASNHACGLTAAGAAWCWGANGSGQLGDSSTTRSSVPVPVSGALAFASISTGYEYTCALTTRGAAYCWGDNGAGQLGDGYGEYRSTIPVAVLGGLTFASLTAGYDHACGVTTAGVAYCWGYNVHGQLGNGTQDNNLVPGPVSGGLVFSALSASWLHTCGLTTSGAAWCWGNNQSGESGNPAAGSRALVPIAVVGGLTFTSLSAGGMYTCGVTTDGGDFCWGDNYFGQLGDGTTAGSDTPVRVVHP